MMRALHRIFHPVLLAALVLAACQGTFEIAIDLTPTQPVGLSATPTLLAPSLWTAATIAAGSNHTCATTRSNGVKCWGDNTSGQLGNGSTVASPIAVDVQGLAGEVGFIVAGANHTCVLSYFLNVGNKVYCWGDNRFGQLGVGAAIVAAATEVSFLAVGGDDAVQIAAGANHTCAHMESDRVICWGANDLGQLGDGTNAASTAPVAVSGLTRPGIPLVAGAAHTCILIDDAAPKCWGNNDRGQLGISTGPSSHVPVDVTGLPGPVYLVAGQSHTCALMGDGSGMCWGDNSSGQLGDGTTTSRYQPAPVSGFRQARLIESSATSQHTCVVFESGLVNCWGSNASGQLGDGTTANQPLPVNVIGLNANATVAAVGSAHTCAVLIYGGVKCWGNNDAGQLGNGTHQPSLLPVDVLGSGGLPLTATSPAPSLPPATPALPITPTPRPVHLLPFVVNDAFEWYRPLYGDIAVAGPDGSLFRQLTAYGYNADPVLSPDQQRIAYRSIPASITSQGDLGERAFEGLYNIWVISIAGEQAWKLTDSELRRSIPVWSPDSQQVAISEGEDSLLVEVEIGTGARRVIADVGTSPRYHPGGDGIGYVNFEGSLVWVDSSGVMRTIVDAPALPQGGVVADFDWFPNDPLVVYSLVDNPGELGATYTVWVAPLDGSGTFRVADDVHDLRVSPDGRTVAGLIGNNYADACMRFMLGAFIYLSPDRTMGRVVSAGHFQRPPETWLGESFFSAARLEWVSDALAVGSFGVSCAPEGTPVVGAYTLDVNAQSMTRISP
jgi:alpha-tubulin suppressor-like RCC1 family protein